MPVKDDDHMNFVFSLPYCGLDHEAAPLKYFSSLIGHEGENSLLSYLKSKDLATALSAGPSQYMNCFTLFQVGITLSKKGLKEYEKVAEAVFQYI